MAISAQDAVRVGLDLPSAPAVLDVYRMDPSPRYHGGMARAACLMHAGGHAPEVDGNDMVEVGHVHGLNRASRLASDHDPGVLEHDVQAAVARGTPRRGP